MKASLVLILLLIFCTFSFADAVESQDTVNIFISKLNQVFKTDYKVSWQATDDCDEYADTENDTIYLCSPSANLFVAAHEYSHLILDRESDDVNLNYYNHLIEEMGITDDLSRTLIEQIEHENVDLLAVKILKLLGYEGHIIIDGFQELISKLGQFDFESEEEKVEFMPVIEKIINMRLTNAFNVFNDNISSMNHWSYVGPIGNHRDFINFLKQSSMDNIVYTHYEIKDDVAYPNLNDAKNSTAIFFQRFYE